MYKLDSFIRESQRLHPLAACKCFPRLDRMRADMVPVLSSRCAMKDYEFSNGMTAPAGTRVALSTHKPHIDDPKHFDCFRFYKLRQESRSKGEFGRKFDTTWMSAHVLYLGAGKYACLGRFFAACELKLMFAHLIMRL